MKTKLLFLLLFVVALNAEAKKLSAFFSYATFHSPAQGPYLETYLNISGASVTYKLNEKNFYQAKVEVVLVLKRNEKIIYYDKYNLFSPEIADTTKGLTDFLDQQRIKIGEGVYDLEITMTDKNTEDHSYSVTEKVDVNFPQDKITISDIELISSHKTVSTESSFSKNGYELVPLVDNYFGPENNLLQFYVEVYNTDKILGTDPWLISYYISLYKRNNVVADLNGFARQQPVPLKGYLAEIPLSQLSSGNYELNVTVKSKTNEVLATKKIFFQRSNGKGSEDYNAQDVNIGETFASSISNKDSLKDYLNCLIPIASISEEQFIDNRVAIADMTQMQYFLYLFWKKRNNENPEAEWQLYREEVKKVNEAYGTRIQKGYKTDRGRVYLKYGPPNSISKFDSEPNAYPYEIWHYYTLGNQSNKKFIFYNKNSSTNDFILLHSDAQGEVYEPRWDMILHQRLNQSGLDWDIERAPSHSGSHSDTEFNNPK